MTTRGGAPPQPHPHPNGNQRAPLSVSSQPQPQPQANGYHHRQYYPTTPARSSSSASFKGCCCCLFLLFSFIALLLLAIVLVIILAVKPKKPQFDLQQVAVQYMGITPDPTNAVMGTTASLSLTIRLVFTAVNPNKVGIKYGESRFTVMYRGIPLGKASVPGFYQDSHSVKQIAATISVDRVNLLQADAADLIRDASLNDRVDLRVLGDVGAKIRVINLDSPGVQVSVDCNIVISPRKQSLTYKQCGFDGNSARFIWKSIPSSIKESQPEVTAVWKIGQRLWLRDYAGVHEAIRGFDWSQDLQGLVAAFSKLYTRKMFQLLLSAYSTISIQHTALFLGMNEEDATNYVLQQGWTVDHASQMLTVKKQPIVAEQKLDPSKLQRLT